MAKNKNKRKLALVPASQSEAQQAQSLFEQYHEFARGLHSSSDQQQAEVALEGITGGTEGVQLALIKSLARVRDADAADVLLALNVLSPLKDVRKEARRGLFQLEQNKIAPRWEPVLEYASPLQSVQVQGNPPRFWKGYVTDSLDVGEVSMVLMWEQGEDYREVRLIGFLLEFTHDGVKDFFTQVDSKRQAMKLVEQNTSEEQYIPCSLAKGKRLLQEAIDVNKKTHTKPFRDYSLNTSLVNELILEAQDVGEETGEELAGAGSEERPAILDLTKLMPLDVIINFIEAWVHKNFTLAYDLLASDSPLRQGLARDVWVERRAQWAEHAKPARLLPGSLKEHKAQASSLWLPPGLRRGSSAQEYEASWSFELADISALQQMPELPDPTAVYKGTGRYWFWATFSFVRKQDRWFIQDIADEGARVRTLPFDQIESKIDELYRQLEKLLTKKRRKDREDEESAWSDLNDAANAIHSALSYTDILVSKPEAPADKIQGAYGMAVTLGFFERAIAYIDVLLERFPEQRAENLSIRAGAEISLIDRYDSEISDEDELDEELEEELDTLIERTREQAIADLRESLSLQESPRTLIMLAGILYSSGSDEQIAEAETLLHRAEQLGLTQEQSIVTTGILGTIASNRQQYDLALEYYKRAAEIDPEIQDIWHKIGDTYLSLNKESEAENSFKKSIEVEPANLVVYSHLVELYLTARRFDDARKLVEQGLIANPDEPYLMALLASVYYEQGNYDQADEILQEAEAIDPDEPIVQEYREIMNRLKEERNKQQ